MLKIGDKQIGFTGDLGPDNRKILHESDPIPYADVMISESTYGGRVREDMSNARVELKKVITDTYSRKGKIIIPELCA